MAEAGVPAIDIAAALLWPHRAEESRKSKRAPVLHHLFMLVHALATMGFVTGRCRISIGKAMQHLCLDAQVYR